MNKLPAAILIVLCGALLLLPSATGGAAIDCSEAALRSVIQAGGSADLGSNCTYTLTGDLPPITADLTLDGHGAVIDGSGFRILEADGNQAINLRSITVKNGKNLYGGALYAAGGSVTLQDSTFEDNSARFGGGGLYLGKGDLTVTNSTIARNTADFGAGVAVLSGKVTLTQANFATNIAGSRGGGGVWAQQGDVTLDHSMFIDNVAGYRGGAAIHTAHGNVTISDSLFINNSAPGGSGGALEVEFLVSGMPRFTGTVTLVRDTFSGNQAGDGGAVSVRNAASVQVMQSSFAINSAAGNGGALVAYGNGLTIVNSIFAQNQATDGAGLYANSASITASTFSENAARGSGGGIYVDAFLVLSQSLVAGNQAPTGNDIFLSKYATPDFRTYNLVGVNDGNFSLGKSNQIQPNPKLAPFAGRVYLLLPGSPALDAIPPDGCATSFDLRGVPRPQGTGCDIGAIEMTAAGATIPTVTPAPIIAGTSTSTPVPTPSAAIACTESALREALQAGGTVSLAPSCIYALTADLLEAAPGSVIKGNGATIDGGAQFAILPQGGIFTVTNLTLRNGKQTGQGATYSGPWTTDIAHYSFVASTPTTNPLVITAKNAAQVTQLDRSAPFNAVDAMVVSPDSALLAVGTNNVTTLFNVRTGKLTPQWSLPVSTQSIAFAPDGKTIATADLTAQSSSYDIHLRDAQTGDVLQTLLGSQDSLYHIAFSPDGTRLASVDSHSVIRLWDIKTGKNLAELRGQRELQGVWFSRDGKYVLSAGDGIRLWDVNTFDPVKIFDQAAYNVSFSPARDMLITGSDNLAGQGALHLYDLTNGALAATLTVNSQSIGSNSPGADGRLLAAVSNDGRIILWDMGTLQPVAMWNKSPQYLGHIALSPDGTLLAIATSAAKSEVWLWGLPRP